METQFHYDAIAYPSTRIGNGEAQYYNLVITPQFIDNYASLNYVVKGTIKKTCNLLMSKMLVLIIMELLNGMSHLLTLMM